VSEKKDGLRVTDAKVLEVARETFTDLNISLVEALHEQGVAAHGLITAAFDAELLDPALGFVGTPTRVHLDLLRSIVGSGAIPVLTCLGIAPGGQLVNINADTATRLLVHAVQPLKIIFLSGTGGLLDEQGKTIESINLATDYDDLTSQNWVHSGMQLKLAEIKALLDDSDPMASVSITTPSGLARELFTHGGSGTLVRKGELIQKVSSKEDIDETRLLELVSLAFGRNLEDSWWPQFDLKTAYISQSYRAAALVTQVNGVDYLDKFAIHGDARGEGLAHTVWRHLVRDHPTLFWRSRTDNSFNSFYVEQADGSIRRGHWTVFWRGEEDFPRISTTVTSILEMPSSFSMDESHG
jgi:acetylglutamate kinase